MAHSKHPARPDALLLSREEARALLGIGSATFDSLLRAGEIPVVRYGRRGVRVRRADLEAFCERAAEPWGVGA